jgi:hypothetical protein
MGQPKLKTGLDTLDRFIYHGWKWHGGINVWQRYIVRAEAAITTKVAMAE